MSFCFYSLTSGFKEFDKMEMSQAPMSQLTSTAEPENSCFQTSKWSYEEEENQTECSAEIDKLRQPEENISIREVNINDLTALSMFNEKLDNKKLEEEEVIDFDQQVDVDLNNQLGKDRQKVEESKIHLVNEALNNREITEEVNQLDPMLSGLLEENRQVSLEVNQLEPLVLNANIQLEDEPVNKMLTEEELENEVVTVAVVKRLEAEELAQLQVEELNNRIMAEELKKKLDAEESDRLHAEELNNLLKAEEFNQLEMEEEASVSKAMELEQKSEECIPKEYIYEHMLAVYSEQKVVLNPDSFKCPICFEEYKENEGILLKECLHSFCRECLISSIKLCDEVDVKCPFIDNDYACGFFISENEIQGLLTTDDYSSRLTKTLKFAEAQVTSSFHCKKADCIGWCIVDGDINVFECPVCSSENCISCEAIHSGYTCSQYAYSLNGLTDDVKKSEVFLKSMVDTGTAMKCPKCSVYVQKIYGCDYLQCSLCKMDLCWATRGPRWGPAGYGDISGGCRCQINGRRCHINCQNCH